MYHEDLLRFTVTSEQFGEGFGGRVNQPSNPRVVRVLVSDGRTITVSLLLAHVDGKEIETFDIGGESGW
jgi:hypothetical protein